MGESFQQCPLCGDGRGTHCFYVDRYREFYRCERCFLIYVPPLYHLPPAEEKAEYDKHQNSPGDLGYRRFLSQLYTPLCQRVKPGSRGLDFGSGPGPTLSVMFEEAGYAMNLYDPFYAPERKVLEQQYDFITASEVLEHCHNPAQDLALLWSLLKNGGWLGIMTGLALDKSAFAAWRYKDDLTHVCFFSKKTMEWLAEQWQAELLPVAKNVCLLQKM